MFNDLCILWTECDSTIICFESTTTRIFFIDDVEILLVWNHYSKSVDTNIWRWRFSSLEHENWRSSFIIFFVFIEKISWYMNVSYFLNFSCDCLNVSRHMKIYMYATKKNIRSIMSKKTTSFRSYLTNYS
jgi:hypothetical protein